jgi:hypothetical protein
MTRVNLVDPRFLQTKHLVAEYRELPRIFALIRKAQDRGESPNDPRNPKVYTLGKGHVRFFYNKAQWLVERQEKLIAECIRREINIQYTTTDHLLDNLDKKWCNNWLPTKEEININIARINARGGLLSEDSQ